ELRSPITSIRGFIAGILDGIIPIDKEKYYLSIVYDEVKRISRLVDDLLDISTLDDSNYILKKSEIDINGLIEICLVNKEAQIAERDLKVEVILNENHQFVYADRDRMIQVLTNLIDNAIKYSYSGEIIRIETSVKGKKVYVSIKNKGKGISEEELVRIWDRFYKSDSSRTNKESTGLGLSIVRTILSRHGEDIWVNSKDGETEFIFTLSKA
ncbi:MAG: HAMP domain-containing histidine kinase, partial [Clostridium sp.]|nr:HAMP domain-containing histidine kinase [Clostridium sp.]